MKWGIILRDVMGNPFLFSSSFPDWWLCSLYFLMQDHALQVFSLKYKPIHGLSSSLSFLPSSEGAATIKDANREPHWLVIRHHRRFSPDVKCPHYLLFLLVLLNSSCGVVPSDSLLFRRCSDDREQGGDDVRRGVKSKPGRFADGC